MAPSSLAYMGVKWVSRCSKGNEEQSTAGDSQNQKQTQTRNAEVTRKPKRSSRFMSETFDIYLATGWIRSQGVPHNSTSDGGRAWGSGECVCRWISSRKSHQERPDISFLCADLAGGSPVRCGVRFLQSLLAMLLLLTFLTRNKVPVSSNADKY